jgi:hypothetical protein
MPTPQPPRRPDARPKPQPKPQLPYEVVEDDDAGFEVVEEKPVAKPPPPRAAAKAPLPPARKPVRAVVEDDDEDDDDEPRSKARTRPQPKPKPKKKAKGRTFVPVDEDQESRDRALTQFEWIFPAVLLGLGVTLTAVAGFAMGGAVGTVVVLMVLAACLCIAVPLTIVALMVIGIVAGIEYGRIGPAILKIAAIAFVVNGVYFLVGGWIGLPFFVVVPIGCAVSFGLFMTQFDLDTWETNASVGVLNTTTFISFIVLIGFLVVAEAGMNGGSDPYDDHDDVPADVEWGDPDPFDDDWDD